MMCWFRAERVRHVVPAYPVSRRGAQSCLRTGADARVLPRSTTGLLTVTPSTVRAEPCLPRQAARRAQLRGRSRGPAVFDACVISGEACLPTPDPLSAYASAG